jgi:hypothetical protein
MTASAFTAQPQRPYDFDVVPLIRKRQDDDPPDFVSLMPNTGGLSGCTYFQCPTALQRDAEMADWVEQWDGQKGWRCVVNMPSYTIRGPLGSIDMVLMVAGTPIRSDAPGTTEQVCLIHDLVYETTGIPDPGPYRPRVHSDDPTPQRAQAGEDRGSEVAALREEIEELKALLTGALQAKDAAAAPSPRRGRPPGSKNKPRKKAARKAR